jgi:hypothetical protein
MKQPGFKRMEHSSYSLDLVPCDFFFRLHEITIERKELSRGGRAFAGAF